MAGSLLPVKTCWIIFILSCLRVVSSQLLTITVNTTGDMWEPWTCRSNVKSVTSNGLVVSIDLDLTSSTGVPSIITTSTVNTESSSSSAPAENHSTKHLITEPTPPEATETLNNEPTSSIAPVVYAVVGAVVGVVGTLLLVLLVLFCLFRQDRLQCVKPTPVSVDSVQMDNMGEPQPANNSQQAVDVSHTSSNIYEVFDPETKASAKDYEAIVTNTYQNV